MNNMQTTPAQPTLHIPPGDRFLKVEDVENQVNLKQAAIYAHMKKGTFPRRYKNGWLQSDIMIYLENIVREGSHLPPLPYSHDRIRQEVSEND